MKTLDDAVLCYVNGSWAFFTTRPLADQRGDDWNDAPYEHNAEPPHDYRPEDGLPEWRVYKVAWDGPFVTPDHGVSNSMFCVDDINRGDIAWLRPSCAPDGTLPIHAGTTFKRFAEIVMGAGGNVFVPAACN